MTAVTLVLGDQLDPAIAALRASDRGDHVVLLAEVTAEAEYVAHHPQKITLVFAAMRHFAAELHAAGWSVDYIALDDPGNTGTLQGEVIRALQRHDAGSVHVTEPGEWRLAHELDDWPRALGVPVYRHADDRFLCSREAFERWTAGRRLLRMEDFYRGMRKRHGVLLDADGRPAGGRWNYDRDNRQPLPKDGLDIPEPPRFVPDAITRAEAERARDRFLAHALPVFGDDQDAMRTGAPGLFHSVLSPYLNLGLLGARDLVARAEQAWRDGRAPLNAVEGFVRQILGWREYVRGVYWHTMPEYAQRNALDQHRPLPWFYWTGDTDMHCLHETIAGTQRHAYAHHIQRLMVTGNFALLAGIEPAEVCEWYLVVYADAYEWVELPNTLGMALFADGGLLGSKPCAASGKYIHRMSDLLPALPVQRERDDRPRCLPVQCLVLALPHAPARAALEQPPHAHAVPQPRPHGCRTAPSIMGASRRVPCPARARRAGVTSSARPQGRNTVTRRLARLGPITQASSVAASWRRDSIRSRRPCAAESGGRKPGRAWRNASCSRRPDKLRARCSRSAASACLMSSTISGRPSTTAITSSRSWLAA